LSARDLYYRPRRGGFGKQEDRPEPRARVSRALAAASFAIMDSGKAEKTASDPLLTPIDPRSPTLCEGGKQKIASLGCLIGVMHRRHSPTAAVGEA
jgi:hypothetical protein